jgi:succinate dehydrogenase / fumarate reductase, flavoprotein subunit
MIRRKLPDISDFCKTYLQVDPIKQPMAIQPTAHYAMGGIPTDKDGRVVHRDGINTPMPGLLRGGRVRLRVGPRREPPGHELIRGHPRVRPACGRQRSALCQRRRLAPLPAQPEDRRRNWIEDALCSNGNESCR